MKLLVRSRKVGGIVGVIEGSRRWLECGRREGEFCGEYGKVRLPDGRDCCAEEGPVCGASAGVARLARGFLRYPLASIRPSTSSSRSSRSFCASFHSAGVEMSVPRRLHLHSAKISSEQPSKPFPAPSPHSRLSSLPLKGKSRMMIRRWWRREARSSGGIGSSAVSRGEQ